MADSQPGNSKVSGINEITDPNTSDAESNTTQDDREKATPGNMIGLDQMIEEARKIKEEEDRKMKEEEDRKMKEEEARKREEEEKGGSDKENWEPDDVQDKPDARLPPPDTTDLTTDSPTDDPLQTDPTTKRALRSRSRDLNYKDLASGRIDLSTGRTEKVKEDKTH